MPERLRVPDELSPAARKEFLRVVTTEKPTHFTASDLSLLIQYCEACALAAKAMDALQRDLPGPRWLALWQAATKVMQGLSMRLRLSPQSRQPNNPSRKPVERLSFFERLQIEGELDGSQRPE
jgi:phage terminase small subunit